MARSEVFDATAITPSGDMPERLTPFISAEPHAIEGDVKSDAPATQNTTSHRAATSGANEQEQKESPRIAGSLPDDAVTLHSEQSGVMGDTEFESVTSAV